MSAFRQPAPISRLSAVGQSRSFVSLHSDARSLASFSDIPKRVIWRLKHFRSQMQTSLKQDGKGKRAKKNLRHRPFVPATLSLKCDLTRSRPVVARQGCEPCLSGRAGMLGRLCAGSPVLRALEVSSRRRRMRTGRGTQFANLRQKERTYASHDCRSARAQGKP